MTFSSHTYLTIRITLFLNLANFCTNPRIEKNLPWKVTREGRSRIGKKKKKKRNSEKKFGRLKKGRIARRSIIIGAAWLVYEIDSTRSREFLRVDRHPPPVVPWELIRNRRGAGSRPMDNCDYDLWSISGPRHRSCSTPIRVIVRLVVRVISTLRCFALIRPIFGESRFSGRLGKDRISIPRKIRKQLIQLTCYSLQVFVRIYT